MGVILTHDQINALATGGPLSLAFWGGNALQTVTVAKSKPRDPQQAVGYRGIVDYTSGVITSNLTLDCILTEDTVEADNTVYDWADEQVTIGVEDYVLTSCNVGFTAGAPATVSYGWITTGTASFLEQQAAPDVLTDGEEAAFAVVMGDDGSAIELVVKDSAGTDITATAVPSGVQSLTMAATVNRDNILDIRSSSPIQFVTTYPVDISCDIETYCIPTVANKFEAFGSIEVKLLGASNHVQTQDWRNGAAPHTYADSTKSLVTVSGLTKTEEGESIAVGGYLTYTATFTGADMLLPLETPV